VAARSRALVRARACGTELLALLREDEHLELGDRGVRGPDVGPGRAAANYARRRRGRGRAPRARTIGAATTRPSGCRPGCTGALAAGSLSVSVCLPGPGPAAAAFSSRPDIDDRLLPKSRTGRPPERLRQKLPRPRARLSSIPGGGSPGHPGPWRDAARPAAVRGRRHDRSRRSARAVASTPSTRATSTTSAHNASGTGIPPAAVLRAPPRHRATGRGSEPVDLVRARVASPGEATRRGATAHASVPEAHLRSPGPSSSRLASFATG
jgi:hypothetical protein